MLNNISAWFVQELELTLPKSLIGKAISYAVRFRDRLMAYIFSGHLEIGNNLMENVFRPIVLGGKNWLLAGLHDAAQTPP
ncbi:MAG: transposase [Bacteroidetes bacterium]|nr:transposase [Bacteroidota bacterium]